jgi:hypothetical protein
MLLAALCGIAASWQVGCSDASTITPPTSEAELVVVEPLSLDRTLLLQHDTLTATVSIRNVGNAAAPAGALVVAARRTGDALEGADLVFTPDDAPASIQPGATVDMRATLRLGAEVQPGQYRASVRIRETHDAWREESAVSFELRSSPALKLGANLISLGNQYIRVEYWGAYLTDLLETLRRSGFQQISIRVIWQPMEPSPGVYDEVNIRALDRILADAETLGLDVMLDFHTRFNDRTQYWQAPAWMAELQVADTANGEVLPAVTMRHLFYSPAVLDAFIAMQQHVISALQHRTSLKYISVMNEPYLNWDSVENDQYFEAALRRTLERLRTVTDKPLGVRWLASWHPWSDEEHKRIGSSLWSSLDFVAMNLYFDPWNDEQRTEDTRIWPMARRARADALQAGKPFFVSEIGTTAESSSERTEYWRAAFANRIRPLQPDAVMIWNAQNDGDFYPSKPTSFNFLSAPGQLAPFARDAILEQVGSVD